MQLSKKKEAGERKKTVPEKKRPILVQRLLWISTSLSGGWPNGQPQSKTSSSAPPFDYLRSATALRSGIWAANGQPQSKTGSGALPFDYLRPATALRSGIWAANGQPQSKTGSAAQPR